MTGLVDCFPTVSTVSRGTTTKTVETVGRCRGCEGQRAKGRGENQMALGLRLGSGRVTEPTPISATFTATIGISKATAHGLRRLTPETDHPVRIDSVTPKDRPLRLRHD